MQMTIEVLPPNPLTIEQSKKNDENQCGYRSNFMHLEIKFHVYTNQIKIFSCASTIQWFEKPMPPLKGLSCLIFTPECEKV